MSKHCAKFQQIRSSRFRVHEKFAIPNKKIIIIIINNKKKKKKEKGVVIELRLQLISFLNFTICKYVSTNISRIKY